MIGVVQFKNLCAIHFYLEVLLITFYQDLLFTSDFKNFFKN